MKSPVMLLSFISIATLAILAVGITMLPNPVVASAAFSIVFLVVAGSVVAAILCEGDAAAVWRGFAVFAVAYFVLAVLVGDVWSAVNNQLGVAAQPPRSPFMTTYFLAWAYDQARQPEIWTGGGTRVPAVHLLRVQRSQLPNDLDISEFEAFVTTGQCAFTLALGLLGAVVGSWLYRVRNDNLAQA